MMCARRRARPFSFSLVLTVGLLPVQRLGGMGSKPLLAPFSTFLLFFLKTLHFSIWFAVHIRRGAKLKHQFSCQILSLTG